MENLVEKTQKIGYFSWFSPLKTDRLYRWVADHNRPINRPFFLPIIGRLIGIGRTLREINVFITNLRFFICFHEIFAEKV